MAAEQEDWTQAAHHLEECVQAAPDLTDAYLHLALAHRHAGATLLAVAWLEAYQEAAGDGANRGAVEAEIRRLLEQARTTTGELLKLAAESGRGIPEEFWGDRQQAFEATAFLQALAGHVQGAVRTSAEGGRVRARSRYLRAHGELLAAAHDYPTVRALLEQMDDPAEADRMRAALARYQLLRGEREEAANTVRELSDAGARQDLLSQLVASYARTLDTREAAALVDEAAGAAGRFSLQQTLLFGYLRAGRLDEAAALARGMRAHPAGDLSAARCVLGEGPQVLAELAGDVPDASEAPRRISEGYLATLAVLWMGEPELARQGCELLEGWIRQFSLTPYASFGAIACGYVNAETGRMDETLTSLETLEPRAQTDFAVSLFWRLARLGRLDDLQRLILALESNPAAQGTLFKELAGLLSAAERHTEAIVTAQVAAEHAQARRLGFVLRELAGWAEAYGQTEFAEALLRRERLAHWAALAGSLGTRESIARLDRFLDGRASGDLRAVTAALQQAAADWISALAYIRAISERHEPG
ncbi:MAG TPA: hypothetical protein VGB20_00815 [bacterium]